MIFRWSVLLTQVLVIALSGAWAAPQTAADREAILKYGIESEVLDLVRTLHQERDTEFRDLLIAAYRTAQSDDLKQELLLFFRDLKDTGLEDDALKDLQSPEEKGNSLLLDDVAYLIAIKSAKAIPILAQLPKNKNRVLAMSAIRALGTLGATDQADALIKMIQDSETDPNAIPDLIWSLGEMKAAAAVSVLVEQYDDNASQPFLRKTILEALGKIKAPEGWAKVQEALTDPNTDLRAEAISLLGAFPDKGDQTGVLTAALRDSEPAVRIAAADAAKQTLNERLKDLLHYRLEKDPDPKVRLAALKALSAYSDGPTTVLSVVSSTKQVAPVWKGAVELMATNNYPGADEAIKKLVVTDDQDSFGALSAALMNALIPHRDAFRQVFGLGLSSKKAPARLAALRAIRLGHYTEYEASIQNLSAHDSDPAVRAEAADVIKSWSSTDKKPDAHS